MDYIRCSIDYKSYPSGLVWSAVRMSASDCDWMIICQLGACCSAAPVSSSFSAAAISVAATRPSFRRHDERPLVNGPAAESCIPLRILPRAERRSTCCISGPRVTIGIVQHGTRLECGGGHDG